MLSHDPLRRAESNAEVLLWQGRFRIGIAAALAASWLLFRTLGLPDGASLGRLWLGAPAHVVAGLGAAGLYVGVVLALGLWLRRVRAAGPGALVVMAVADAAALFATIFFFTPPDAYARGLLLSFFALQLTQLYFGRALAALAVVLAALSYTTLVALAIDAGVALVWVRELWTLYLYLVGAVGFLLFQGGMSARLARLAGMFRRVEEGDFTEAYDAQADRRPDNVTAMGRAYNRMRLQLATIVLTDPLSGCLNRRGFEEQLSRETARGARAGCELSLLAIDVDYLKQINDRFGHLAGDAAISEIGHLLRDVARNGDVVARIGGDEFMILAPDTNAAGAANLAHRIADAFRARTFAAVKGRLPITASLGVVTEAKVTEGLAEDLRARADEALYSAKRGGRNCVVVWSQGLQPFATGAYEVRRSTECGVLSAEC